ncbi:hypothetical protein ZWY2020_007115 [Hordeum vulgare]|nr:hypothetical protein ZWY2020_007115 [Hordeum vulgare]
MAMGLVHVDALHDALGDLLDLPKAQGELSDTGGNVDRLLYSFLRLADAHGCFQEAVVALKQDVAEALAAVHRRDGAPIRCGAAAGMSRRLAAARECSSRPSRLSILDGGQGSATEVEVTGS